MNTLEITNAIPQTDHRTAADAGAVRLPLSRGLWEPRLRFALYVVNALLMVWLTASVIASITEFDSTLDTIKVQLAAPSFNL